MTCVAFEFMLRHKVCITNGHRSMGKQESRFYIARKLCLEKTKNRKSLFSCKLLHMKVFTPSAYAYTCNYTSLGGRQMIFLPPVNYLAVTIINRYARRPLKIFNECQVIWGNLHPDTWNLLAPYELKIVMALTSLRKNLYVYWCTSFLKISLC